MSEIYKISQALEDLRNYYGLRHISRVTLNMDKDDPEITFVSNKPKMFTNSEMPDKVVYVLKLELRVDSLLDEHIDQSDFTPRTEEGEK